MRAAAGPLIHQLIARSVRSQERMEGVALADVVNIDAVPGTCCRRRSR